MGGYAPLIRFRDMFVVRLLILAGQGNLLRLEIGRLGVLSLVIWETPHTTFNLDFSRRRATTEHRCLISSR
jgi:hypothetical protein